MPQYDAFLSHNSDDKPVVERLAARLEDEAGIKPYLDKWHLIPGDPWQEALEAALDASSTCVVCLGSSGLGSWENEEMRTALDERLHRAEFRVIPLLLPGADPKEPATLPRFLRRLTWVDFRAGVDEEEPFRYLVAGIRGEPPGRETQDRGEGIAPRAGVLRRATQWVRAVLPTIAPVLPTVLAAVTIALLMNWRVPSRVHLELSASRILFTVAGENWTPILNSVFFDSLSISDYTSIRLSPASLEVADPALYDLERDQYPASAWHRLSVTGPVEVNAGARSLHPTASFESPAAPSSGAGNLAAVTARPGAEVVLEAAAADPAMTLVVKGQESRVVFSLQHGFQLVVDHGILAGVEESPHADESLTLRGSLAPGQPVEVEGQTDSLVLSLNLAPADVVPLFPRGAIRVGQLDFTRQLETGERGSSLLQEGFLSYPAFPGVDKVGLVASDSLALEGLREFRIEEIAFEPRNHLLRLTASGIARQIRTGTVEAPNDHRLTLFDQLRHRPTAGALIFAGWVLLTFWAVRRRREAGRLS